ncbi:MAG: ion channel [Polyangiales bacterium]
MSSSDRLALVASRQRTTASVVRLGAPERPMTDAYHQLLASSWPRTIGVVLGLYLALNTVFAGLYLLGGDCIENARPGSFSDAFFFSIQTMATIGYGKLTPVGPWANGLVALEALFGILYAAMSTGLMFAKFSRPTARVVFSAPICFARRDGVRSVFFRMANARGNQIVEASARLTLSRVERTAEGESVRRFHELPLVRSSNQVFALTWTAVHAITPGSVLDGETLESLEEADAMFVVTVLGTDDTFGQTVHARHSYFPDDIAWGHRFVDVVSRDDEGRRVVDYTRFDSTQPQDLDDYPSSPASPPASAATDASAGGPAG